MTSATDKCRRVTSAADRPDTLPAGLSAYRVVGPFDSESLPEGLLREHRLKEGVWGLLHLLEGNVRFVWDDAGGGEVVLAAPTEMVVPPTVPHHLEHDGDFRLTITFHR